MNYRRYDRKRLGLSAALLATLMSFGGCSTAASGDGAGDAGGEDTGAVSGPVADGHAVGEISGKAPVVAGCQIFPDDNFWNVRVDGLPVHRKSADYIGHIGASTPLYADFGTWWDGKKNGINFDIIAADQPMQSIDFYYGEESDCQPGETAESRLCERDKQPTEYPIPPNPTTEEGSDKHILLVQRETCLLWEVFDATRDRQGWHGGSGAIWDLSKNEVRRHDDTSADGAGLPIFPGLVRYEEIFPEGPNGPLGEIHHALRFTIETVQDGYFRPASKSDGGRIRSCEYAIDSDCPPMGMRMRLKADYDISGFAPPIQVLLRAIKQYGLVLADTGGEMYISGVHNPNWDDRMLRQLRKIPISELEVVDMGQPVCKYASGGNKCNFPE